MCMFSQPVQSVSQTRIFARMLSPGRQLLVYAMQYRAVEALAMILPLPVPVGSDEEAVSFLDLSGHPAFFDHLDRCFDRLVVHSGDSRASAAQLRVHTVGAFETSFVPTLADFARLDPCFRLDDEVMAALPGYADGGFVVVQLRELATDEGTAQLHPIAFTFPTRHPDHLFYPTLHVHDGTVPDRAGFAHTLYAQHHDLRPFGPWRPWPEESGRAPALHWDRTRHLNDGASRARDLLASDQILFRARLRGPMPNVDLWLALD